MSQPDAAATRDFLEQRFERTAGSYQPHQPIFGIKSGEPGQFLRLGRTLRLLSWIEALRPQSVLDLGAAEGYIANLLRLRLGCPVLCSDLSRAACDRAAEIYGLPCIAGDLTRLPLQPGCADVVLLSEVFEHLPDPQAGLSAALTYARRYVVFSTQELCASEFERGLRLMLADLDSPHAELNFVTRADFAALFGDEARLAPQFRRTRRRLLDDVAPGQWRSHVGWLAEATSWHNSEGLLAVISVDGTAVPAMPKQFDPALLDLLLAGPPSAAPQSTLPWDWLTAERPTGLVCTAEAEGISELHTTLRGKEQVFARLHVASTPASASQRRQAARLLTWLERLGSLTCGDPLRVKLRWLLRRPLA